MDGDHSISYANVRAINNLDSSDVPDEILEFHLDTAKAEAERLLKTSISSSQPSFSNIVFNTRDLYKGTYGTILYFSDFKDYIPIVSITTVEYRSTDGNSYETLTEGMEEDYIVDLNIGAIKFNDFLVIDGSNNLKITGTYGYLTASTPQRISYLIGLLAALQGVTYASGGVYQDIKTYSIGNVSVSKGQYNVNLKQQYDLIKEKLNQHLISCGITLDRVQASLV